MTPGGLLVVLERTLRGRDDAFFGLLEAAADNVAATARLLNELFTNFPDSAELADEIAAREHEGDRITHEVIRRLNQEFVTPIDREDILALASALDDVVDFMDEAAAYLRLYCVEASMLQADGLSQVLVDATRELALAVRGVKGFDDISAHTVEIHRLENEADQLVRHAIASLFEDRIDPMVVIRWKDIFERLEDATDAAEQAASVIDGIVIKNV